MLSCPVCLGAFNLDTRCPRLLPSCGHGICTVSLLLLAPVDARLLEAGKKHAQACLAELLRRCGFGSLRCPECRSEVPVVGEFQVRTFIFLHNG